MSHPVFFENHPDPMLVCDPETLGLVRVNRAAVDYLGYPEATLRTMSLADLRGSGNSAAPDDAISRDGPDLCQSGVWRLRHASGAVLHADVRCQPLENPGEGAILASLRDISRVIELERELVAVNQRLQEQDTNLRMAERLLKIGVWRGNTETGELRWSDNTYRIFEVDPGAFGHSIGDYFELVHPDDRPALFMQYLAFSGSSEPYCTFEHRIVKSEGRVAHIRFIGEMTGSERGPRTVITGVVQDVTDAVEAAERLEKATTLLRIAGDIAHLGGWRADLREGHLSWTPQTATIHQVPSGFAPSLDEAVAYYAPEYRDRLETVFRRCVEHGEAYDEVMQIITAHGNRVWVRTIGEAELDDKGAVIAVQGAFQDVSELIEAQKRAEKMSRRLVDTLESISDAFYTLDENWCFTFVNPEAERVLQRSAAELLKERLWVSFPDLIGTRFHREFLEARASRQTRRFEAYYARLDAWLEVNVYPMSDHGLAVYFRDTSGERRRDEQLRLLEAAVERQNDIVLITEADPIDPPDGPRIVYVNEAFVRRTGYTREEALGRTPRILQGPNTQRRELNRIREALERHEPVRAELINYTRSGEEFWVELDVVPLANDEGRYTHYVAIERDATERKRGEAALRISDERFRLLARATNDAIWDWDFLAGTIWWNEGLRTLFGHDPATIEPGPESWLNRIHPEDKERVLASMHAVIEGTGTRWAEEYRFLHADGHAVTVVDRGFLIRSESGIAIRMLGCMVDVTRQREQDDRMRRSQRLEAVGQLTGGVAHDFNNLLTVILGNSELLSERLSDQPPLRVLAEMTVGAAERGAQLTNRLLAFSRRQLLDPRQVDVYQLVKDLDGMARRLLRENIEIEIIGAERLWMAEVDPGQLEVALLNLVINARDAMPDGGCLTIEVSNAVLDPAYARQQDEVVPGDYVLLSVSDTGTGMSPDVAARAFEPFFTTKEVGKGSGLGLSMVYGFVKQSGGHARLYSEPGLGTTVRLYVPRAGTGEREHEPIVPEAETVGGSEHILVVEDDTLVREHLTAQLNGLGYRITSADNGPRALAVLEDLEDVELLFTDVIMPGGMNGRELAIAAQQMRPGLKVLFTSGYAESAVVHHGRLDSDVHLLSKPYRRQELAAKLRRVLDES